MRDLILAPDVTVDGFMAGPDNELDFMVGDDELDQTMMTDELTSRADAIVVGRKAYRDMAGYWPTATHPVAQWMNTTPKFVLSNTIADAREWENSTVVPGDGVAAVRRLKDGPGRALAVFGGVQTVTSLVAAGVVDEFWLKVNPVAIGHGAAIFRDLKDRTSLELVSARSFPSGKVALVYRTASAG
jgi:dihydrofolate reductase